MASAIPTKIGEVVTNINNLPQLISDKFKDTLTYLFVPDKVQGYETFQDLLKSKFAVFYKVSDTIKQGQGHEQEYDEVIKIKLPVVDIEVTLIDFTYVKPLLTATKAIMTALLYIWLAQHIMKEFNPNISVD